MSFYRYLYSRAGGLCLSHLQRFSHEILSPLPWTSAAVHKRDSLAQDPSFSGLYNQGSTCPQMGEWVQLPSGWDGQ